MNGESVAKKHLSLDCEEPQPPHFLHLSAKRLAAFSLSLAVLAADTFKDGRLENIDGHTDTSLPTRRTV